MTAQIIAALLAASLAARGILQLPVDKRPGEVTDGMAQTRGNREVQADALGITISPAGKLAVMADGIGRENTGKVCAALAVRRFMDDFEYYKVLHNPEYFFERTMHSVHRNIQKTLGERRGGASVGCAFLAGGRLHYALAGQVKIALLRNGDLIPLSEGQTIRTLAQEAYAQGRLTRQAAVRSMKEETVWNYAGKDGFGRLEVCEVPVALKKGDLVVMMTRGIFEEVSGTELESILSSPVTTAEEKAERIVEAAKLSQSQDKENGSVMVLLTNGAMR